MRDALDAMVRTAASVDPRLVLLALLLTLDSWSIALVWSATVPRREKVLWSGVIVLCPIIGCLFWFVLGPNAPRPRS